MIYALFQRALIVFDIFSNVFQKALSAQCFDIFRTALNVFLYFFKSTPVSILGSPKAHHSLSAVLRVRYV